MHNYFNTLSLREKLKQLGQCRLMDSSEFNKGCQFIKDWNIVILGCGAQGLNQGLNMRDSGCQISYALREEAIKEKRASYQNAIQHGFKTDLFEALIPKADLILNLTPDKQHSSVINKIMPMMKKNAVLSYSHGFNIVEEGIQIRKDITVIMVAPKCPGTEVRAEYQRGFGVPSLIAIHPENDLQKKGLETAKAYASAIGSDRAGVLHSSFIAEVKSDLMGEQTILCGLLQASTILAHEKMISNGIGSGFAAALIQNGWEVITEALKLGGITLMMDRLSNPEKLKAYHISETLKQILRPLYEKHMDNIMNGQFSNVMMQDWKNNDQDLLAWREQTSKTSFENAPQSNEHIEEQYYFDKNILLVAIIKSGVELAFETMVSSGIIEESAYYESLHETPLIANLIARKRLYEMNRIISDTAEYGCYLFSNAAIPLLREYVNTLSGEVIGDGLSNENKKIDNLELLEINEKIQSHPIEKTGKKLRQYMKNKPLKL